MRLDFPRAILALLVATACSAASPPRLVRSLPDGGEPPDDGSLPVDGAPVDVPVHIPGNPGVGGHAEADHPVGDVNNTGLAPVVTPPITTAASGSLMVVCLGRGNKANFTALGPPTDNEGNSYQLLDTVHEYGSFPDSGTGVYIVPDAKGGAGFKVTAKNGQNTSTNIDELTMFVVEVVEGTAVHDVKWNQVEVNQPPSSVTSASVTTSGPATLIACWWGDAGDLQDVQPDSSFSRIDKQLNAVNYVQGALAVRNVTAAATYSVTWTATPAQNAQMWLIAVQ